MFNLLSTRYEYDRMDAITVFATAAHQLDVASFMLAYPHPVLVYRGSAASGLSSEPGVALFKTRHASDGVTPFAYPSVLASGQSPQPLAVSVLEKRGANAEGITLGRMPGNDVRIPLPRISKTHAMLSRAADGAFMLTDMGTTNGTIVTGKTLTPKTPHPLPDNATVELGPYVFTFMLAATFHAFLLVLPDR